MPESLSVFGSDIVDHFVHSLVNQMAAVLHAKCLKLEVFDSERVHHEIGHQIGEHCSFTVSPTDTFVIQLTLDKAKQAKQMC
jgi:hypothetical protein